MALLGLRFSDRKPSQGGNRRARSWAALRPRGRFARHPLAAQQPQHDDDDQNNSQNSAQSRAAVVAMRVISAAAAEQQHHDYDDDDEVHLRSSWPTTFRAGSTSFMFRRVSDRVVGAAYRVLNLADRAVDLAVALQFGVADRFADRGFRGALDHFGRSVDSVLVHKMRSC